MPVANHLYYVAGFLRSYHCRGSYVGGAENRVRPFREKMSETSNQLRAFWTLPKALLPSDNHLPQDVNMFQGVHIVKDLFKALVHSGFWEQVHGIKFGYKARYTEGVVIFVGLRGIEV